MKHDLLALRASAGSGKTFRLSWRYVALLLQGAAPSKILALTFTKKAAKEMEQRIVKNLHLLTDGRVGDEVVALLKEEGIPPSLLHKQAPQALKNYLDGDPRIMTIDAFFAWMLRRFCWYAGVSPKFSIMPERTREITQTLLSSLQIHELDQLGDLGAFQEQSLSNVIDLFFQLTALEKELPPIPPATDGAHTALLEEAILKQARILQEAVQNYPKIHKSALKTVDFNDFATFLEKFKTVLGNSTLQEYAFFKKLDHAAADAAFTEIKQLLCNYYRIKEAYTLHVLLRFFQRFSQERRHSKQRRRELSFDDVTHHCFELQESIEREFLYFRLDERIEHLLIDEFQDTSVLQYKILQPLIEEIKSGAGVTESRSFFFVGDTKQSIYRFRGSNRHLFDIAACDIPTESLPKNYRSSRSIVTFVNRVFAPLLPDYFEQIPHRPQEGFVQITTTDELLEQLCTSLARLLEIGHDPGTIAILTFKNDDILTLQEYLATEHPDLQFVTDTSSRLINQPGPKALINLLKYGLNGESIYRANFLAQTGKNPEDSLSLPPLSPLDSPLSILHRLIEEHHLSDPHTLRLLEIAARHRTLHELVDDLELLDETIDPQSSHGVRLMTIHKSKGLEFDNVIVCDSLSRDSHRQSGLLFARDGLTLQQIMIRYKLREHVDPAYAALLEEEKNAQDEDLLHTLYVALTRAENNLLIIQSPKGKLSRLELDDQELGRLEPITTAAPKQPQMPIKPLILKNYGRQSGFLSEPKNREYRPDHLPAIHFGNAAHLFFESLHRLDSTDTSIALGHVRNRYGYLLHNRFTQLEESLQQTLQLPLWKEIASYRIHKEVAFAFQGEQGRLDLLAIGKHEAVIVDFKTSSQIQPAYRIQLGFYKQAVQTILDLPVRTFLVLVGSNACASEIIL